METQWRYKKYFKNQSGVKERMKNFKNIFLIILFFLPSNLAGQIKYEREYDLEKEKVPQLASAFINRCCPNNKVKWYGEEGLTGKTIEAKINYGGSLYSIEFDTAGRMQDVEKKIVLYDIYQDTRLVIVKKLDSIFTKSKIDKIQVQWIGSNEALCELIEKNNSLLPHIINYEIVVKGRKGKSSKMYELLFSMHGSILSVLEIAQRNTDNLDY